MLAKDVHQFAGKIGVLLKSNTNLQKIVMPLVQLLKNNTKFEWSEDCERAFQELKSAFAAPPILRKPVFGVPLILYISVGHTSVGAVLVQEMEKQTQLVYFVSHTFQGAEIRYQKIEKAALAVLMASRKLRPYFQTH